MEEPRTHTDRATAPPSGGDGQAAASAPAERERRPLWERVVKWVGIVVGALVLLVLAFLLYLRTEPGRGWVEGLVLGQIENLLAEDATVEVERIGGGFLTGARVLGLVIEEGGEPAIRIDTLEIDYNLLTLLDGRFGADHLRVAGLDVVARQRADSTWNLARLLAPSDPADTTATSGGLTIVIDEALLRDARVAVRYYNPRRDSVLTVRDLAADFSGFTSGPDGLRVGLDTLVAAVEPPDPRPEPLAVALSGALTGEDARFGRLALESATTDLLGEGRVDWSGEALEFAVDLRATPLDFADVRGLVPVPLYGTHTLTVEAEGTPEEIAATLVASFEDGGGADLDVRLDLTEGAIRYAADGSVSSFNPQTLLGEAVPAADITAALDVDLRGTAPEALSGTFDLDVRDSRVADRRIGRAEVRGTAEGGRFQFEAAAALPGLRATARGTARPFAPTPTYDLRGDVAEADLATLLRNPEQTGRFSGTFAVEGQGVDPQTAIAAVNVQLREGAYGDVVLDAADLTASLSRGTVRYNAEAVVQGGGFVAATGTAQPFAEPLVYAVEEGRLQNFNLAAVTGDTTTTDLTGTFALSGRGTPPDGDLTVRANLRDSRYGDYTVAAADLDATLQNGLLDFDVAADLAEAGRVDATGTARPFAEPITVDAQGRVENLDLAVLTGDEAQSSDLTGAFDVTLTGTDPETLAADLQLDLERSRFRQQEVLAGTVTGQIREGALDLTIDAETPEGAVAFAVTGRPFDEVPTLALSEGTFRGVNLALILDNPALQTSLNGRIELDADGFDPQAGQVEARITLLPSTINAARLDGGTVVLDADRGFVEASAQLDFEDGRAEAAFEGRPFDETPTYDLAGELARVDFAALLGDDTAGDTRLSLAFDVEGEGLDPETMDLAGRLRGGDTVLPGGTIDSLRTEFALADGVLQLDDLLLRSSFADATGEGRVALFEEVAATETDFRLQAAIKDTAPFQPFLPQPVTLDEGRLSVRAYGAPGDPLRFDAEVEAQTLAYGEYRASRFDADVNGEYRPEARTDTLLAPVIGQARVEFDFLAVPGFMLRGGDVTAQYDGTDLAAFGAFGVDERRDLEFRLRTEVAENANALVLETFD
ncbi:MAG: hypothetical protein R3362_02135, partial [Rhodothermales bacterium]|nr:hypothetical protein [Rhodothermales bacterium]